LMAQDSRLLAQGSWHKTQDSSPRLLAQDSRLNSAPKAHGTRLKTQLSAQGPRLMTPASYHDFHCSLATASALSIACPSHHAPSAHGPLLCALRPLLCALCSLLSDPQLPLARPQACWPVSRSGAC